MYEEHMISGTFPDIAGRFSVRECRVFILPYKLANVSETHNCQNSKRLSTSDTTYMWT
jgi:hypothetical protein